MFWLYVHNLAKEFFDSLAAINIKEFLDHVKPFEDVFSKEQATKLATHMKHDHAIDLELGKDPLYQLLYWLSLKELEVLKEYIVSSLAKGWICKSKSLAGALVLFTLKKDGSLWLYVDYHGLNVIMIKNHYLLSLIGETINRLAKTKIYTQLNLQDVYHHIQIKKGDEWKIIFHTCYGHYKYAVLLFRLSNTPITFQSYVNQALSDLLDVCYVAYLNDIIIYLQDESSHIDDV